MGREIAAALGATTRTDGWLAGPEVLVAWAIGHLAHIAPFAAYGPEYEKPAWDVLPLLPNAFQYALDESKAEHFERLEKLLHRPLVTHVINACDPGREGELIFDLIYRLAGCQKPRLRLWLDDLTPPTIRTAFARMRPAEDYEGLRLAAHARQQADWLLGLNGSYAGGKRARECGHTGAFSVGRVQTPVLQMVVARDQQIAAFVPEKYYEVVAEFAAPTGTYRGRWCAASGTAPATVTSPAPEPGATATATAHRTDAATAQRLVAAVTGQPGHITRAAAERVTEPPPQLYDLTTLQKEANRKLGLSAQETLDTVQRLYEAQLVSYPRTNSRYVTQAVAQEFPRILQALATDANYQSYAQTALGPHAAQPLTDKRFVNDAKAAEHYALIPTSRSATAATWASLGATARELYDLIARRFLGLFYPAAQWQQVTVTTLVATHHFLTRGRTLQTPGWRVLLSGTTPTLTDGRDAAPEHADDADADAPTEAGDRAPLPPLAQGTRVTTRSAQSQAKQTRPPAAFTEATLLGAMETAGREIADDTLREALRDKGLGTPATRAAIIEKNLARGYLERVTVGKGKKKGATLRSTARGRLVQGSVPAGSALNSPLLTGEWEAALAQIAAGTAPAAPFLAQVKEATRHLVAAFRTASFPAPESVAAPAGALACPACATAATASPHAGHIAPDSDAPRPAPDTGNAPLSGGWLREATSAHGKFLSCSQKCGYTSDAPSQARQARALTEGRCPNCQGPVKLRHSAQGAWYPCAGRECRGVYRPPESGRTAPPRKTR